MKKTIVLAAALSLISLYAINACQKEDSTPVVSSEQPKVEKTEPIKKSEEPMKEEKKLNNLVQELSAENAELIIANVPLLVIDFYAEWCGPCKTLKPTFEEAAVHFGNKYVFAKINIDNCKEIATKYNIQSIPTILVFSNGKVLGKITGLVSKETLIEKIESASKGPQDLSKLSKEELNEKLWQAVYTMESADEIKRFIDAGADVNYAKNGATPLVMVIMNCGMRGMDATPLIQLFLNAGATTQVTDPAGKATELADAATQMGDNMRAMAQNYDKMAQTIKDHKEKSLKATKKCDGNVCQL